MKRILAWLLLAVTMLSLCGCGTEPSHTETTAAAETQATVQETAPQLSDANLFLKVSSITFSVVGESEDIYLGLVPREDVTWESDDPSVVAVENGVLTATGVGTTTVRATYGDKQVSCTAGCLAATREELLTLDKQVLSSPKRLPPQIDLEEPCTYFDNAAIVGDSITYCLMQAEAKNNYLGNVVFLSRQGISINSLVKRFKNIYFKGREMNIEDITAKCEADRIYIMLGTLDFQVHSARRLLMENWNTMLDRITEKSPDLEIVIISNIPCFTEEMEPIRHNTAVSEATVQIRQLAADRGHGFVDLGYYIEDHCGRMAAVYSDDTYHMNTEGSLVWMQILRYYAQYETEGGSLS